MEREQADAARHLSSASQMCSMAHCDFPHQVDYTLKVCAKIKVYPLRSLYQRSHHSNKRRNQDPTYPQVSRLHSLPSYSCEVLLHLCSLFAVCSSLLIDLILFLNEACTITQVPKRTVLPSTVRTLPSHSILCLSFSPNISTLDTLFLGLSPFIYPFIYSSLVQYILTTASSPSTLPGPPTTRFTCSSTSPQEKAGLPGLSTKQSITRSSKTRHKPSCGGWKRQHSGRKRISRASEESETASHSHCQEPHKTLQLNNHNRHMHRT